MEKKHTDRKYEKDLEELRQRLLLMVGRVEEMVSNSISALVNRDAILARKTIESDSKVNLDEIEIDELCLVILAKRQPMASDLRFITLAMKMVTDIERIGDLAVNICERAIDLSTQPPLQPVAAISKMGGGVRGMLKDAIEAFIENDAEKAQQVIKRDDEIDALYTQIFCDVLSVMIQNSNAVSRGIQLQSVAKWLERMADHSTNLAELVVFKIKGKDIRHVGKIDVR